MHVPRSPRSLPALLLLPLALTAQSSWFGTWKLNRDKSTTTGDTVTIARVGDHYGVDFGAFKYELKEDGLDYPVMPTRTVSFQATGDRQWLRTWKTNGQVTSRTTMALSPNGNTLVEHTSGTHPDGSAYSKEVTEVRVGTGSGLAGVWKTVNDSSSEPETLVYSDAGGGAMKMERLETKSFLITHFDGKPAKDSASPEQALAIKATGPTSYTWTLFMNGKEFVQGVNTLTPDGKAFQEVNWLVTKPAEKYTMIYERQ